jgi:hypothetical protein
LFQSSEKPAQYVSNPWKTALALLAVAGLWCGVACAETEDEMLRRQHQEMQQLQAKYQEPASKLSSDSTAYRDLMQSFRKEKVDLIARQARERAQAVALPAAPVTEPPSQADLLAQKTRELVDLRDKYEKLIDQNGMRGQRDAPAFKSLMERYDRAVSMVEQTYAREGLKAPTAAPPVNSMADHYAGQQKLYEVQLNDPMLVRDTSAKQVARALAQSAEKAGILPSQPGGSLGTLTGFQPGSDASVPAFWEKVRKLQKGASPLEAGVYTADMPPWAREQAVRQFNVEQARALQAVEKRLERVLPPDPAAKAALDQFRSKTAPTLHSGTKAFFPEQPARTTPPPAPQPATTSAQNPPPVSNHEALNQAQRMLADLERQNQAFQAQQQSGTPQSPASQQMCLRNTRGDILPEYTRDPKVFEAILEEVMKGRSDAQILADLKAGKLGGGKPPQGPGQPPVASAGEPRGGGKGKPAPALLAGGPEQKLPPPGQPEPKLLPPGKPEPKLLPPGQPEQKLLPPGKAEPKLLPPGQPEPKLLTAGRPEPKLLPPGSPEPKLLPPGGANQQVQNLQAPASKPAGALPSYLQKGTPENTELNNVLRRAREQQVQAARADAINKFQLDMLKRGLKPGDADYVKAEGQLAGELKQIGPGPDERANYYRPETVVKPEPPAGQPPKHLAGPGSVKPPSDGHPPPVTIDKPSQPRNDGGGGGHHGGGGGAVAVTEEPHAAQPTRATGRVEVPHGPVTESKFVKPSSGSTMAGANPNTTITFEPGDFAYGPSAKGELRKMGDKRGARLLNDVYDDIRVSPDEHPNEVTKRLIDQVGKSPDGKIRFDLTHMQDVEKILRGEAHMDKVTSTELRYIIENWERLKNKVVFYETKNGKFQEAVGFVERAKQMYKPEGGTAATGHGTVSTGGPRPEPTAQTAPGSRSGNQPHGTTAGTTGRGPPPGLNQPTDSGRTLGTLDGHPGNRPPTQPRPPVTGSEVTLGNVNETGRTLGTLDGHPGNRPPTQPRPPVTGSEVTLGNVNETGRTLGTLDGHPGNRQPPPSRPPTPPASAASAGGPQGPRPPNDGTRYVAPGSPEHQAALQQMKNEASQKLKGHLSALEQEELAAYQKKQVRDMGKHGDGLKSEVFDPHNTPEEAIAKLEQFKQKAAASGNSPKEIQAAQQAADRAIAAQQKRAAELAKAAADARNAQPPSTGKTRPVTVDPEMVKASGGLFQNQQQVEEYHAAVEQWKNSKGKGPAPQPPKGPSGATFWPQDPQSGPRVGDRAATWQQAEQLADAKIKNFEDAVKYGKGNKTQLALELQSDPLAVQRMNKNSSPEVKQAHVDATDGVKNNIREQVKTEIAKKYNLLKPDGTPDTSRVVVEDMTSRKPGDAPKVGQDWDHTVKVKTADGRMIEVPTKAAAPIVEQATYNVTKSKPGSPLANSRGVPVAPDKLAEHLGVTTTDHLHPEAFDNSPKTGQQLAKGEVPQQFNDPAQVSKAMQHKSDVARNKALDAQKGNNPTVQMEPWEMEQARQGAKMNDFIKGGKDAQGNYRPGYIDQKNAQLAAQGSDVRAQIPEHVQKGMDILQKVKDGNLSPGEARKQLAGMGETPDSIIQKNAGLVEALDTLKPGGGSKGSMVAGGGSDPFVQNVRDRIELNQMKKPEGAPRIDLNNPTRPMGQEAANVTIADGSMSKGGPTKSLLDGGKSSFVPPEEPGAMSRGLDAVSKGASSVRGTIQGWEQNVQGADAKLMQQLGATTEAPVGSSGARQWLNSSDGKFSGQNVMDKVGKGIIILEAGHQGLNYADAGTDVYDVRKGQWKNITDAEANKKFDQMDGAAKNLIAMGAGGMIIAATPGGAVIASGVAVGQAGYEGGKLAGAKLEEHNAVKMSEQQIKNVQDMYNRKLDNGDISLAPGVTREQLMASIGQGPSALGRDNMILNSASLGTTATKDMGDIDNLINKTRPGSDDAMNLNKLYVDLKVGNNEERLKAHQQLEAYKLQQQLKEKTPLPDLPSRYAPLSADDQQKITNIKDSWEDERDPTKKAKLGDIYQALQYGDEEQKRQARTELASLGSSRSSSGDQQPLQARPDGTSDSSMAGATPAQQSGNASGTGYLGLLPDSLPGVKTVKDWTKSAGDAIDGLNEKMQYVKDMKKAGLMNDAEASDFINQFIAEKYKDATSGGPSDATTGPAAPTTRKLTPEEAERIANKVMQNMGLATAQNTGPDSPIQKALNAFPDKPEPKEQLPPEPPPDPDAGKKDRLKNYADSMNGWGDETQKKMDALQQQINDSRDSSKKKELLAQMADLQKDKDDYNSRVSATQKELRDLGVNYTPGVTPPKVTYDDNGKPVTADGYNANQLNNNNWQIANQAGGLGDDIAKLQAQIFASHNSADKKELMNQLQEKFNQLGGLGKDMNDNNNLLNALGQNNPSLSGMEPTAGDGKNIKIPQVSVLAGVMGNFDAEKAKNTTSALANLELQQKDVRAGWVSYEAFNQIKNILDAAGYQGNLTRSQAAQLLAQAQQGNSWGNIIGNSLVDSLTQGGQNFGQTLGGAGANVVKNVMQGTKPPDSGGGGGDGSGGSGPSGGGDGSGPTSTGGGGGNPGGGDGGGGMPPGGGGGDPGGSSGGSNPGGGGGGDQGIVGSTTNPDGTVTVVYSCGNTWTGVPPAPVKCPKCGQGDQTSTTANTGGGGPGVGTGPGGGGGTPSGAGGLPQKGSGGQVADGGKTSPGGGSSGGGAPNCWVCLRCGTRWPLSQGSSRCTKCQSVNIIQAHYPGYAGAAGGGAAQPVADRCYVKEWYPDKHWGDGDVTKEAMFHCKKSGDWRRSTFRWVESTCQKCGGPMN